MKKKWLPFVLFVMMTGLLCTVSCANMGTVFSSGYGLTSQIKENALEHERFLEEHMFVYEAVIFGLNEANLSSSAKALLRQKAAWLTKHPDTNVVIEGHCDSLGSDTYNFVLGEKRGQKVKDFMIEMGIDESRMEVISYGEVNPVDIGKAEEELVKNRRVVFSIVI